MRQTVRSGPVLAGLVLGLGLAMFAPSPARAQMGMDFGFFGGFNTVPSPTSFLNDRALNAGARGMQPRPSHSPYSGNPNSYFNRVRDNGLVPHYDVGTAAPAAYRPPPRRASAPVAAAPAPAAAKAQAPAKPSLPLVSFFDAARRLVWPAESPVEGELQTKRDRSDEASLAVLDEQTRLKEASLSMVNLARQRLLDYGQPALQEIRRTQTPRIADSFHLFLLSLYESLAQAAMPAPTAAQR